MKYILNYEEFFEARLFDIGKINGDENSDVYKKIKEYYNKKKIILDIEWYDTIEHSIYKRIKDRTNFKSISEFNEYFKNILYSIYPGKITKFINNGKYSLYDSVQNITIIVYIKDMLNNNLKVLTILNGFSDVDTISVIYI